MKTNLDIQNQNLMNEFQSKPLPGQFDVQKGMYVGYEPGTYSKTRPDSPDTAAWKVKERRRQALSPAYVGTAVAAENARREKFNIPFVGDQSNQGRQADRYFEYQQQHYATQSRNRINFR
jgi:hypothetical protein